MSPPCELSLNFPILISLNSLADPVLEGIALVGNPKFAIIDEAFPYLSKRLLTDDAPRLRAALRYALGSPHPKRRVVLLTDGAVAGTEHLLAEAGRQKSPIYTVCWVQNLTCKMFALSV